MNKTEMLTLKMNLFGGMDSYIRERFDPETIWMWELVLDTHIINETTLRIIASDDYEWARVCAYFGTLVRLETM